MRGGEDCLPFSGPRAVTVSNSTRCVVVDRRHAVAVATFRIGPTCLRRTIADPALVGVDGAAIHLVGLRWAEPAGAARRTRSADVAIAQPSVREASRPGALLLRLAGYTSIRGCRRARGVDRRCVDSGRGVRNGCIAQSRYVRCRVRRRRRRNVARCRCSTMLVRSFATSARQACKEDDTRSQLSTNPHRWR